MIRFSANLGFLWTELPLPEAIVAAGRAGFDAVECHAPYAFEASAVEAALQEVGLKMISLNTSAGDRELGEIGLGAVPGRESEARSLIDEAIEYAVAIDCANVSILSGRTGRTGEAEMAYQSNLAYAAANAAAHNLTILIEPLNTAVAADYHLVHAFDGVRTIEHVGAPNLKLMIDCFHTRKMDGALAPVMSAVIGHVGHVQFSSYPGRNEPFRDLTPGGIDYDELLPFIRGLGFDGPFGAEYNPTTTVEAGLGWLAPWHQNRSHNGSGNDDRENTGDDQ